MSKFCRKTRLIFRDNTYSDAKSCRKFVEKCGDLWYAVGKAEMLKMATAENLTKEKTSKNDEFYTQYEDIQKEVNVYLEFDPDVFRSKTVRLPCDDPEWSNFARFFAQNFENFGLKKLIRTSYAADSKPSDIPYQFTLFESESPRFDESKTKSHGKIFDLFSRKVVAYRVSPKNSTYLITSTFRQAYQNRNAPQSLMFHSDQGAQYTSKTFRKLLRMNKVVQSFSAPGQPHDNAVMESFFSFIKREEIYRTHYKSEQQFAKSVDDYIEFYNTQRPHSTL